MKWSNSLHRSCQTEITFSHNQSKFQLETSRWRLWTCYLWKAHEAIQAFSFLARTVLLYSCAAESIVYMPKLHSIKCNKSCVSGNYLHQSWDVISLGQIVLSPPSAVESNKCFKWTLGEVSHPMAVNPKEWSKNYVFRTCH